jgi:hypothetical protein
VLWRNERKSELIFGDLIFGEVAFGDLTFGEPTGHPNGKLGSNFQNP